MTGEVVYVSPQHTIDKLSTGLIDDKIDVFEDQIQGFFLNHADALQSVDHSDIAVLTLIAPLIETIVSYERGESSDKKSQRFFSDGIRNIFPQLVSDANAAGVDLKKPLSALYSDLRSGLLHEAMIRGRVRLLKGKKTIAIMLDSTHRVTKFEIYPRAFLQAVQQYLTGYIERLRDTNNRELRAHFEREFDRRYPTTVLPSSTP